MRPFLAAAPVIALLASINPLGATVSINGQVGGLRDSSGVLISSTATLWALVADTNGDQKLPGGLNTNDSLTVVDSASAYAAFKGLTIGSALTIGGDQVLFTGEFNSPTSTNGVAAFKPGLSPNPPFNPADNGLATGDIYGIYWFPGFDLTNNVLPTTPFQIGGINEITKYVGSGSNFIGMKMPSDGANVTTGVLDANIYPAGALPTSRFTAIDAIPEPSGGLLSLLGLALLRRRR